MPRNRAPGEGRGLRGRLPSPKLPRPKRPRRSGGAAAATAAPGAGAAGGPPPSTRRGRVLARLRRRPVVLGAAGLLVVVAAVLLLTGGGDPEPTGEAGSRFGSGDDGRAGGTLLDALAPVLGAQGGSRRGSDPQPPSAKELGRSPADAVAGLFLVGFRGTTPNAPFLDRLKVRPYGGVLLTRSNYVDQTQLAALTAGVQSVARGAGHPAPLVAAVQEGGPLNAFPRLGPRAQVALGEAGPPSVRADALGAGGRLGAAGVGVNLAPVADLAVGGGPAQGRAFADTPGRVTSAVRAALDGYRRRGVAAVVRHFPGQGAAAQDPKDGPAPVGLSLEELRESDMKPFAAVARGRAAAPAIQLSNAIYVAYDGVTPATLLPEVVEELRDRMGYRGLIVSGDLTAATATTGGSVGEAAVEALKAGADLLVVPGSRVEQDDAFRKVVAAVRRGDIRPARVVQALKRIAALRRFTRRTRTPSPVG